MSDKEKVDLVALAYAREFGEIFSAVDRAFGLLYQKTAMDRRYEADRLVAECRKLTRAAERLRGQFELDARSSG